jgi:hypothetical protein
VQVRETATTPPSAATGKATATTKSGRGRRAPAKPRYEVVSTGKLISLLAGSDGMSTRDLARATNGDPARVLALLKEQEDAKLVRRRSRTWSCRPGRCTRRDPLVRVVGGAGPHGRSHRPGNHDRPSHVSALVIGDHRNCSSPAGGRLVPVGSNIHTRPSRALARAVARATSGLAEVTTAGPMYADTAGMITPLVLPDRGGPSSSTARSGRANRHCPSSPAPSHTPPPACAASARIARNGSASAGIAALLGARGRARDARTASITTSATRATISTTATPITLKWIALADQEPRAHEGDQHRWLGDPPSARLGLMRRSPPVRPAPGTRLTILNGDYASSNRSIQGRRNRHVRPSRLASSSPRRAR